MSNPVQIFSRNTNTVKNLSLKWIQTGLTTGCGETGTAAAGDGGGFGTGEANNCGTARLGGGILVVDGMIYASSPDNVWKIDARDGTVHWHCYWKTRGGASLQTRSLGMWHNYTYFEYFELHDDWVVCLNAKTGKEVWKKEIASFDAQCFDAQYFSSNAPMILGNHVIVGTGNDMDSAATGIPSTVRRLTRTVVRQVCRYCDGGITRDTVAGVRPHRNTPATRCVRDTHMLSRS